MLLDCVGEDSWESLRLQGDQTSQSYKKSVLNIRRIDTEAEPPIFWPPDVKNWLIGKDPDAGKDWRQEEKGTTEDEMGWMASPTQWTWVWVNSRSWWWTGRPGVLQSMGSQRVGCNWGTAQQHSITDLILPSEALCCSSQHLQTRSLSPGEHAGRFLFVCVSIYTVSTAWSVTNTCKINRAVVLKTIYIAPP